MTISTKVSKTGVWLVLGILCLAGAQSAACSKPFHTCYETRTCAPPLPEDEAGAAGESFGGASGETAGSTGGKSGAGRGGTGVSGGAPGISGADDTGEVDQGGQAGAAQTTPLSCDAGTYACNNACVPDGNVHLCGASCIACPTVAHGAPACIGGTCTVECATGYHMCNQQCVDSTSIQNCGTGCEPCTVPNGGSATCDSGVCNATCPSGKKLCLGACIASDAPCDGTCGSGSHACGGLCLSNSSTNSCGGLCAPCALPTGASSASCDGSMCSFTCSPGYHRCESSCAANNDVTECGASCTKCTAPANATASCDGTSCKFTCKPGFTGDNCEYPRMQSTPLATGYTGSVISAMSDDGSIVVGAMGNGANAGNYQDAFRWTTSSPTVTTGSVSGQVNAWATVVSGDGTRIYGHTDHVVFEWRANQAPSQMLNIPVDSDFSACSTTGLTVVGNLPSVNTDPSWPFIYDVTSGTLSTQTSAPYANARFKGLSGNGLTVVGGASSAIKWTSSGGLGELPGGSGFANSTSPNGQYAAGQTAGQATLWSGAGLQTVTLLGKLATLPQWFTEGRDVSQDGTVVVGRALPPFGGTNVAVIWTSTGGLQKLSDALATAGIDVSAWEQLQEAEAVSTNGKVIAGTGVKGGVTLGFVARLP